MRASLAGAGFMIRRPSDGSELCRWRTGWRSPRVSVLINFPGLGIAVFQAHVASRIRRAAKSNFIPCKGVRIVRTHYILDKQKPEPVNRQSSPDLLTGGRTPIVQCLQHRFLFEGIKIIKRFAVQMLRHN